MRIFSSLYSSCLLSPTLLCGLALSVSVSCSDDGGSGSGDGGGGGGGNCPTVSLPSTAGKTPDSKMNFFVSSSGNGARGGNLGGLSCADKKCQELAANVGAGSRTWHAYLSTDSPVVNARDRIGSGPWFNYAGVEIASSLTQLHNHPAGNILGSAILDEVGAPVPPVPNHDHDILTGSDKSGNLQAGKTCSNWKDGTDNSGAQVGHADIEAGASDQSWNSQHDPQCSESALKATAGTGRIFCFAVD